MATETTTTFDNSFAQELATESWTLYAIGMCVITLRVYARIRFVGVKGLQPDDYIIFVSGALYTTLIVCLNVIADGGGSNLYPPGTYATFTPEDIRERIKGSKIVIVSEQAMLNVIYSLKTCLLIFYSRLTSGLGHQRMVKMLGVAVACGWVGTELAFFFACRPFSGYWAVPPPNPQCTTLQHYAITQACFNITTDFCMLVICLPLVYRMNVPWRQKTVLLIIFSMGLFVIIAAILTKVYNLADVYSTSYMLWYVRESSVAVYVANLPMIWPLLREWFPILRNIGSSGSKKGYKGQYPSMSAITGNAKGANPKIGASRASRNGTQSGSNLGTNMDKDTIAFSVFDREVMRADSESDEGYEMAEHNAHSKNTVEGEILRTRTVVIKEDDGTPGDWDNREQVCPV